MLEKTNIRELNNLVHCVQINLKLSFKLSVLGTLSAKFVF